MLGLNIVEVPPIFYRNVASEVGQKVCLQYHIESSHTGQHLSVLRNFISEKVGIPPSNIQRNLLIIYFIL